MVKPREAHVDAFGRWYRLIASLGICGIVFWWSGSASGQASGQRVETIVFPPSPTADVERTCFQAASGWNPAYDIRSDVAIVYGISDSLTKRIAGYQERGYRIHLMTGVAWGWYGDYFEGRWDGKPHMHEEGQKDRAGKTLWHGNSTTIPYVMPGENYTRYLKTLVKQAIDAGVHAIHMEEPEFWVRAGYSDGFKAEWQAFYGEPWQPPHESPDARYRCAKLKYHLYYRTLESLFKYIKEISDGTVACYVPTHSLVSYSQWRIVSPESSLMDLAEADGYIAQVWTGTARTPNRYRGTVKERTFETALIEYGQMKSMVRPTGRRVYFLADPVEDNPNHGWDDYKINYECTLIASLFYPSVFHFEVMPWPSRVFLGTYPKQDPRRKDADTGRVRLPKRYATELLTLINALNDMKQPEVVWDVGGRGVGCLLSDSMMFQRGDPHGSDPQMGSLFGLMMPLLKGGLFVEPVQLETVLTPAALAPYDVLLLTYEHQKPLRAAYHDALVKWVRAGGVLVVVDDETDPYNRVREWWNRGEAKFETPLAELRHRLGLPKKAENVTRRVGRGAFVQYVRSPAELTKTADGADFVREIVRDALEIARGKKGTWQERNHILLRRGPYVIVNVFDESLDDQPFVLSGRFLDLFDPGHTIQNTVTLAPGQRRLLIDLERVGKEPRVLASASRITDWAVSKDRISFLSKGPADTVCTTSCLVPNQPIRVEGNGNTIERTRYTETPIGGVLQFDYPNVPDGVRITIRLKSKS